MPLSAVPKIAIAKLGGVREARRCLKNVGLKLDDSEFMCTSSGDLCVDGVGRRRVGWWRSAFVMRSRELHFCLAPTIRPQTLGSATSSMLTTSILSAVNYSKLDNSLGNGMEPGASILLSLSCMPFEGDRTFRVGQTCLP
jgi:hypothetical protein